MIHVKMIVQDKKQRMQRLLGFFLWTEKADYFHIQLLPIY